MNSIKNKINNLIFEKTSNSIFEKTNNSIFRKINIVLFLIPILYFSILEIESFAIDKPTYIDWMRDYYDVPDTVTDEEIANKYVYEDETGRVMITNSKTLTYENYDGKKGFVGVTRGYSLSNKADFLIRRGDVAEKGSDGVAYFNQRECGNALYGNQLLSEEGCGPTSVAMVISTLADASATPEMIATRYANFHVENNGSKRTLISKAARDYGLNVNEIYYNDKDSLISALTSGHMLIMICGPGIFTNGGHFIVLTGIDSDGLISVNDPYDRNKSTFWNGSKYTVKQILENASPTSGTAFWEIYN